MAAALRREGTPIPDADITVLEHDKNKHAFEARKLDMKAREDKRDMTAEEQGKFDELVDKSLKIQQKIKQLRALNDVLLEAAEPERDPVLPGGEGRSNIINLKERRYRGSRSRDVKRFNQDDMRAAMGDVFRDRCESIRSLEHLVEDYGYERRELSLDTAIEGGYLAPPVQWMQEIIKDIDDQVYIMSAARVIEVTTGQKLVIPRRTARLSAIQWAGEKQAPVKDTALAYGETTLDPNEAKVQILVSESLIELGGSIAEEEARGEIAYAFAIGLEQAMLTGAGVGRPLGVYIGSDIGIPTTRDITGSNTATELMPDTLYDALYNQKAQFWQKMRWHGHRDTFLKIAKFKDSDGRYLWQPAYQLGQPDLILGRPFDMSEFAPNTFTASSYVLGLFDWSQYYVARMFGFRIIVLNELYRETGKIGFLAKTRIDAKPIKAEAFTRVKLSA